MRAVPLLKLFRRAPNGIFRAASVAVSNFMGALVDLPGLIIGGSFYRIYLIHWMLGFS